MSDSFDRWAKSRKLTWQRPPEDVSRRTRRLPEGAPLPPPAEGADEGSVAPDGVRSSQLGDAASGMISHTLPRIKVTFLLRPPVGDGVWTLQGRAWFEADAGEQVSVALVQGRNVIGEAMIRPADTFRFQDVLLRDWTLEFHFQDGDTAVVRHESG